VKTKRKPHRRVNHHHRRVTVFLTGAGMLALVGVTAYLHGIQPHIAAAMEAVVVGVTTKLSETLIG